MTKFKSQGFNNTFKNARKAVEVAEDIDLQDLLIETDCPYMAPEPFRGRRSDSSMIAFTAAKAAKIKGVPTEELIDITCRNGMKMYGIE
jgi:TatD DNase family protein